MSISDISPCKDCEDRHFKCHSSCEKYMTFRFKCDEVKEKRARYYRDVYGWISEEEHKRGLAELHARRVSRKD